MGNVKRLVSGYKILVFVQVFQKKKKKEGKIEVMKASFWEFIIRRPFS